MAQNKTRFFKLGIAASIFYDAALKLKILQGSPGKFDPESVEQGKELKDGKKRKKFYNKLVTALAQGHISEITEEEYNAIKAKKAEHLGVVQEEVKNQQPEPDGDDEPIDFTTMTKAELDAHAVENFSDEDAAEVTKLKTLPEKLAKVQELAVEYEDDGEEK